MKRLLRQHRYALLVAVRRLLAQPFSSLSNILVIGLSLVLPIIAASILVSAQPVVRPIPVSLELLLFINPIACANQAKQLPDQLRKQKDQEITNTKIITSTTGHDTTDTRQ